ncbi:MAG: hypothetical protein NC133_03370 [Prevotella sp.]|nr:hypothetical protein [Prevotella sp.]
MNKQLENIKLPYQQARDLLMSIQNESGAAIQPFGIYNFFYGYLQKNYPSKMNKVKARNIASVYCALLNEFYITNGNENPHIWFYMTEKHWAKYGLGRKAIYNSVTFLRDNQFILTRVKPHPYITINKVRFYCIDLDALAIILQATAHYNPHHWR